MEQENSRHFWLMKLCLVASVTAWVATVSADTGTSHTPLVIAHIYECTLNGQRVFSDQPCAANATPREVGVSNRMSAQEAAINYHASPTPRVKRKTTRAEPTKDDTRQKRCAALAQDKNDINSRMRAGYKNNEGERLRARLRKIDNEYHDLRCGSFH